MNNKSRYVWAGLLLVVAMITLVSIFSSVDSEEPATIAVFDVPILIGKNLAELTTAIGVPDENTEPNERQIQLGTTTWEKSWKKDGYFLMATYEIQTKKVTDLFLGSDTDAANMQFRDTKNILRVGNLSISSPDYSVEFVRARNAPGYTGAIVTAK